MAKAYGYIIVYNNNGDIVYQHKGSGGDYGGTVSLSNNIVTISSDYAPQVEPIDDSDPDFPDRWSTVIDTGEVNVSNVSSPTSLKIVLPYNASKIRYFGGQFGEFADAAGSGFADAIINNGETTTLTANNYTSGGGCAIQYYEEATSKVSVDLTTLTGWSSLSSGSHNITIIAKADGYRDSEPSAAVSVTVSSGYNVSLTLTTNPSGNAYSHYFVHTDTNPTAQVRAAGSSSGNPSPSHLDLSGINELWLNIGLNEDRKNFTFKYSINGAPVQSGTSITITQDCNITIQVPWFD